MAIASPAVWRTPGGLGRRTVVGGAAASALAATAAVALVRVGLDGRDAALQPATAPAADDPSTNKPSVAAAPAAQSGAVTLAIENVTLFDGTVSPRRPHTTVLLSGDRIAAVLDRLPSLPEGTPTIDGTGLTLLPGLIDTHAHIVEDWMGALFVRYGVTSVRDLGSNLRAILELRLRESRGTLIGPRIVPYGRAINGMGGSGTPVYSPDNARQAATNLIEHGVEGLLVRSLLPAPELREVVKVAEAHRLPVAASVETVSAREAADFGVTSIEHVSGVTTRETADTEKQLAAHLAERGVFLSATLHTQHVPLEFPAIDPATYLHLDRLPWQVADLWRAGRVGVTDFLPWPPERADPLRRELERREVFVRRFHEAGGRVTTGTNTPAMFVMPGISLHQELERLVAVGLSATDALRSATSVAAELLRRPDLGIIAPGKLADLLLVEGDPAVNVSATRNVRVVLKGGAIVHEASAPAL